MTTANVRADGAVRPSAADPDLSEALIPTPCTENHASFLAWLPDGSLGCAWFGGSTEGRPDIYIYFSRLPADADTWTPPVRVSRDDGRSEQNPVLAALPNCDLWVLYTSQEYGSQDTAVVVQQRSIDLGANWSEPETLFDTAGTFIRQGVVQLGDKHWLLPLFHCHQLPGRQWHGDADTSAVAITENGGATWSEVEVPGSTGAVHMCIVALDNGELTGFFRSRWADAVYRSTSVDEGRTWTVPAALDVPNNNSSIQVTNAGDSVLLMVANPVSAPAEAALGDASLERSDKDKVVASGKAVPLERHAVWGQPRLPLSLLSSHDNGLTWTRVLDLEDESTLGPEKDLPRKRIGAEMSYPTVVVDETGDAHISYSYYRDAIKYVRVPRARFA